MRPLYVACWTAPGIRSVTIEQDCILVSANNDVGNIVISTDPTLTAANAILPSAEGQRKDVIALLISSIGGGFISPKNLNFPLRAGEKIYLANQSLGACMLYFDDMPAEQ
jgi:hypothetical protein